MDKRSFFKAHASVLFTFGTLCLSLVFLVASILLAEYRFWGSLLEHLAAMGIAAFVAAIFFSFRDVREVLAGSISVLLLDGDVARYLGATQRSSLRKRLLLESLQLPVKTPPEGMIEFLDRVAAECVTTPYLTDFHVTVVLSDAEQYPGFIRRHYRCHYLVNAHKDGALYPLRVRHEIVDPSGQLTAEDVLKQFEVRVGEETFGIKHANVAHGLSGGTPVKVVSFERDIPVSVGTNVSISLDALCDRRATTEAIRILAPTKGCEATLSYKEGIMYDVAWFRPGQHRAQTTPNSITAYTHEWLLPGHGLVLCAEDVAGPDTLHRTPEVSGLSGPSNTP